MSEILETKLGQIEYTSRGKGQPILFLHGGHSSCQETLFHKGYDQNQFQLITPSRPGYGQTPLNNLKQPKDAAQLIASLVKKMNLENLIVVGISAGGLTAIELAVHFPNKVVKLILISAVTKKWMTPQDALYRSGKRLFAPKMEKFSWTMFRVFFRLFPQKMTQILFDELSTKQDQVITPDEITAIREMTFKQHSGSGFVTDLEQDIAETVITKIKCPTLILHSENDKSVNIEMASYAKEKIAHSIWKTYDNKWGHLLWIGEDSKAPIHDVNEFIKQN